MDGKSGTTCPIVRELFAIVDPERKVAGEAFLLLQHSLGNDAKNIRILIDSNQLAVKILLSGPRSMIYEYQFAVS